MIVNFKRELPVHDAIQTLSLKHSHVVTGQAYDNVVYIFND